MAYERLKDTAFSRGIADVVGDFARLFQAEFRLAKAEIGSSVREKIQSAVWFGAAGSLALAGLIFLGQGIAAAVGPKRVGDALVEFCSRCSIHCGDRNMYDHRSLEGTTGRYTQTYGTPDASRYRHSKGAAFMTQSATSVSDWLLNSARKNPEGALLLAAGAVLLLRRSGAVAAIADSDLAHQLRSRCGLQRIQSRTWRAMRRAQRRRQPNNMFLIRSAL